MGMEIYNLSNKSQFLGTIKSLDSIKKELEIFKSKTGYSIDEYGTTRIYADHIKLLFELTNEKANDWNEILKKTVDSKVGLLIEGD